ncbi:SDR family oxidoreductase [Bdellovibrio sp. HCB274]|uniref:SDR family oxidoreductase n=1 Tax=Bdellovibrio sp. HCB274 TaxID=3394361 RepID=UPI0039B3DF6F
MIAVTGATGHLGILAIKELLDRGTKASEIVAVVRNKGKAQDLVSKGIEVREADYGNAESLIKAFQGIEKLLFISGSEVGARVPQHTNIMSAAKKANIKFIAYTSILNIENSTLLLAKEHQFTEKLIRDSGIPHAFLRNGWYIENYSERLESALQTGAIVGSAGNGKLSAATRADYAAAAAIVITSKTNGNSVYELGGDAFTMSEFAAVVSKVSGKKIEYKNMPPGEYTKLLMSFGLPAVFAEALADSDAGISRGELYTDRDDLKKLIGRPLTTLEAAIKKSLQQ